MPTLVPYEQVVEITREIEKSMEWRSITFEEMPTATQLAGEVSSIGDYVKRMIPQVGSVDQGILQDITVKLEVISRDLAAVGLRAGEINV